MVIMYHRKVLNLVLRLQLFSRGVQAPLPPYPYSIYSLCNTSAFEQRRLQILSLISLIRFNTPASSCFGTGGIYFRLLCLTFLSKNKLGHCIQSTFTLGCSGFGVLPGVSLLRFTTVPLVASWAYYKIH
jgi:hypothetical protein